MGLFLDSAFIDEARRLFTTGLVKGITTNPSLIANTHQPAFAVITQLCELSSGIVFHQLTAESRAQKKEEAIRMAGIRPGRVGLKIPCTYENLSLAAELVSSGYVVGMTAIFSPSQVYLACQAGVQYVIPYVNRSTRLLGDGIDLVRQMRQVIDAVGARTEILAASIKTPEEAISALLAGAHHLTLPLQLIESMGEHPLSNQAIEEFSAAQKD
ncbi:MAG: transaldolase family protein [Anaerolineales bacterium]